MLWKACQRGGRRNGGEAKNGKEKVTRRGVSLARSDNLINSCSALAHDAYCDTVGGTDDDCSGVNPPTPPMPKQDDACQAPRPYACGCNETPHKTKAQLAIEHCLETHPCDLPYCRQGHENEALCSVCGGRARSSRRTCIGRIGGGKIFAWPSASRRARSTRCFTGSAVSASRFAPAGWRAPMPSSSSRTDGAASRRSPACAGSPAMLISAGPFVTPTATRPATR